MIDFNLSRYGDCAFLIELDEPSAVVTLRDSLVSQPDRPLRSVVPATRTVLVEFDPGQLTEEQLAELVARCLAAPPDGPAGSVPAAGEPVLIPVRYDGADLTEVAQAVGMSEEAVIDCHLNGEYLVQFCGFSPGFGYLTGLDERLWLPRHANPRASVPAGSVAIADQYTGIYPRSSPGGWRLIGRTAVELFDIDRLPPALLRPGRPVRFVRQ